MPTIKQLEDQGRALLDDQRALVNDTSRPWASKQKEYEDREKDIAAVLKQRDDLKAVDSSPFGNLLDTQAPPTPESPRTERGMRAGLVQSGYRATGTPQLDLTTEQVRDMHAAATSGRPYGVTVPLPLNAATDSTSITPAGIPDYRLPPVTARREPTRVLSLIPTVATEHPSVTWYSTTGTAAAAAVAEGGTKPTSTIAYTPQTSSVTKIAHVAEVTDETLADFPAFLGVLTQDMTDGLIFAENAEVLTASVAGAHKFPGLLNATGILTGTAVPATPSQTDRLDAIGAAMDQLRVGSAYTTPDGIVMHPSTWGTIRRNKDAQSRYLLGDPGTPGDPRIFGVPVVLTTQIPAGTVLIGDFAGSTAAYIREGIRVEANNAGEAQWKNNTTLIRAEERLLVTVPRPSGLIKVTGF